MNVDRVAYDAAIKQLEVAKENFKAYRTAYVKEVRDVGVQLRKLFCNDDTMIGWIQNTCAYHPTANGLGGNQIGMELMVDTARCAPEALEAIKDYLTTNGWLGLTTSPHYDSTRIRVY